MKNQDETLDHRYHLLVKFSPKDTSAFYSGDVAGAHNAISEKLGTALFGKSGRAFSQAIVSTLTRSITDKQCCMLIILCGKGTGRGYFAATIKGFFANKRPELTRIPSYYRDRFNFIKQWIEIGPFRELTQSEIDKLVIASSGRRMSDIAPRCQAPYMLLQECLPNAVKGTSDNSSNESIHSSESARRNKKWHSK
jgi:hypothetical protein